jgi:hypothetical protein
MTTTRDPLSPQWEDCKVCGGDHWTKDHPHDTPEAEIARQRARFSDLMEEKSLVIGKVVSRDATIARLRAALMDYGVHRKGCGAWKVDTHRWVANLPQCDCGLNAAYRAALAPSEPPDIHVYPVGEGHEMSTDCFCRPKIHPPVTTPTKP